MEIWQKYATVVLLDRSCSSKNSQQWSFLFDPFQAKNSQQWSFLIDPAHKLLSDQI